MGMTKSGDDKSDVNLGVPVEYKNYAVSTDFLDEPLSFATYNHLIKSQKLYIPTIYLFAKDTN